MVRVGLVAEVHLELLDVDDAHRVHLVRIRVRVRVRVRWLGLVLGG